MNDSDRDFVLLKELDRPVAPRPEFADALRARLLRELVATNGARTPRAARPSPWALLVRHRRPALAGAIAIAAAAAAIVAAVLVSRPSPASAIDVIHQARQAFATTPSFKATLHVDLNPEGPNRVVPKGATATVQVSYGGPNRFRTEIVSEQPRVPGASAPGSYQVFDGRRLGTFDSSRNTFNSSPAARFEPLQFLSWRGAYPTWDRVCRGPDSRVMPDARSAGRDARHIRCLAF